MINIFRCSLYDNKFNICWLDESFEKNQQNQQKFQENGFICNVVQYEDSLLKYQKMKTAAPNTGVSVNDTEHYFAY